MTPLYYPAVGPYCNLPVGIISDNKIQTISIFPNPFSSSTTIQAENFLHNATLTLDNCLGQTVSQMQNISGQTFVFSRNNLPGGLYFARLKQHDQINWIFKLLIVDN